MSMRFVAYFDYLGFKEFIENNNIETITQILKNNFRDMENALAHGEIVRTPNGVRADLTMSKLNCLNYSDTIVFYTNDNSIESLVEILQVSYRFNWQCVDFFFPVRGCVSYGDFVDIKFDHENSQGGTYRINSIFGQAIIDAYSKAENQAWAGTVIDNKIVNFLEEQQINVNDFLSLYAKMYSVPYKENSPSHDEWAMHLVEVEGALSDEAYTNMSTNIRENFAKHNKSTNHPGVQAKIDNTLAFLASYK